MEISVDIDDDKLLKIALEYLYQEIEYKAFSDLCEILFDYGNHYIRDNVGLAIASIDDPILIHLIRYAINKENIEELKDDLQLVLDQLLETQKNKNLFKKGI